MAQSHPASEPHAYVRPAENGKHQFVILAWPGDAIQHYNAFEGSRAEVTDTISAIAEAVARFEPVKLIVEEKDLERANARFSDRNSKNLHKINVCTVSTGCPDIWMRDMAPTFTVSNNGRKLHGVDFNFNGWGGRESSESCLKLGKSLLSELGISRITSSIVAEGGAIEVDGQGTLIASESSIINDNRNPGKTREDIEAELSRALGIRKFIWVPGRKKLDSTDFHIDAFARFVRPGVVLCSKPRDALVGQSKAQSEWIEAHREARQILATATDARGRTLEIVDVLEPRIEDAGEVLDVPAEEFADYRPVFSYVNFLLVDGGVILSQFGDAEADAAALETVRRAFPEREVVPVNAYSLGMFGGGIHCVSQEVPFA
ncbi:hypothetical protein V2A60_001292 [Cordyceps javanica]|uniref:Peptidylarginine deiminase-like enzyme n=1 Tax=Cordyceps javanica TaxID=43265 RepID=A0A545VEN0_9HYPO|nr:peptidylarginine deiminase-like enzyme [Cordyceps javanica]TQW11386.1 peptidylarginine deiminase-like enzyme [Cordyceps javanica]